MASIDQFKAQLLGGGPRANRFRVFIPRSGNKIEFLCQSAQIPAAQVGVVEQQFRGSVLKLAGDRTFEPWNVTIINDIEFFIGLFPKLKKKKTIINIKLKKTIIKLYYSICQ